MHKEEVVSELVNIRVQIASLKLREKELYEKLDLRNGEATPVVKTRVELFKVIPPAPVVRSRKKFGMLARRNMSLASKRSWANLTAEQRAERGRQMSEARRRNKEAKNGLKKVA